MSDVEVFVFVVVLEDSHTDPVVSVHATRAGADARVEAHKASYDLALRPRMEIVHREPECDDEDAS